MTRKQLTMLASWLYHNDYDNPIRFEIYSFLEPYGLHYLTVIKEPIPQNIKEKLAEHGKYIANGKTK